MVKGRLSEFGDLSGFCKVLIKLIFLESVMFMSVIGPKNLTQEQYTRIRLIRFAIFYPERRVSIEGTEK